MKVCYIKEKEETCNIVKRIIVKIKKIFNIIERSKVEDKTLYFLPIFENARISKYSIKRISKKIVKELDKDGIQNVALSNYLETIEFLKLKLYCENVNIIDGRLLFKCLIYEVIEYLLKIKKKRIEEAEVTILINDFNDINKETIILIGKSIKRLNIVTNHISKLKKIQDYLYNEFGVILNVSNNRKNSLLKSEIIINLDFPTELVNQYKINNRAIIVNILEKIVILKKKFNGININYFKINMPDEYKMNGFNNEIMYESIIYNYKGLNNIRKIIEKDKIKIEKLIGNNGGIKESEISTI